MILNLTNTNFEEVVLLNDDEETPISLCGKKQVPILKYEEGIMIESLDIINFINSKHNFLSQSKSNKIENWALKSTSYLYKLVFPRIIKLGLPEFKTESAIQYFKNKKEVNMGINFEEALSQTKHLTKQAEDHLKELSEILPNSKKISKDDITLFPILKLLSCVDGLNFNFKVSNYVNSLSLISKIPLYKKV